MNYEVFSPVVELQPFVKCFWTLEDDGTSAPERQRVLPDGCMEMIFHYGDHYRQYFEDGRNVIQPKCFVFGQISSYIEIEPTGRTGIVAARFFPEGLVPFIEIAIAELENRAVDLYDLFGDEGIKLEVNVISASGNPSRIKLIEEFLLSKLATPQTIDNITKACVQAIFQSQGQIGVVELADKMNINRRNMERRFISAVGLSPKQLSRVARLQATLKMLNQKEYSSLTSLAYKSGYYDQAHFIKDFKEFTGLSPKSFFSENLQLATIFATAD
jgi:AraC-like DNA-binding protein